MKAEKVTLIDERGKLMHTVGVINTTNGMLHIGGLASLNHIRYLLSNEHITWIRGHHGAESEAGKALLAANALTREPRSSFGMFVTVGFGAHTSTTPDPKNEL